MKRAGCQARMPVKIPCIEGIKRIENRGSSYHRAEQGGQPVIGARSGSAEKESLQRLVKELIWSGTERMGRLTLTAVGSYAEREHNVRVFIKRTYCRRIQQVWGQAGEWKCDQ